MEKNKQSKLYEMLKNMSDYSVQQPKVIEDLCNGLFISPAYNPALDLMVESFLTVHSFVILMFEGLISNASAILRILIEQVATITVICRNKKAMAEFLKFQSWKKQYYGSEGEEHNRIRDFLFKKSEYKHKKESALKDYLDYGWIRVINNSKFERSDKLIIKEAGFEEVIVDINEQLNAFAHGQRSIFSFIKNKDLADRHVSRIVMIAGKLFLFLCGAKHDLLVNESMTKDKFYNSYLNAKILYLDLNAKAINNRIIDILKTSKNLDKEIAYCISTLDHERGLMYQSELNYLQANAIARTYVLESINFMFMICYKLYANSNQKILEGVITFSDFVTKIGINRIDEIYKNVQHHISLTILFEMAESIDDEWGPIRQNGSFAELDETFITDFASLIHSMFDVAYGGLDKNQLLNSFVPID